MRVNKYRCRGGSHQKLDMSCDKKSMIIKLPYILLTREKKLSHYIYFQNALNGVAFGEHEMHPNKCL